MTQSITELWRAYGDDGSETAYEVAEALGCSRSWVSKLRSWSADERTIKARWAAYGDDGSEPAEVVAAALDCSPDYVGELRLEARYERPDPDTPRCSRCDFFEDEQRPIVTPAVEGRLREALAGEPRPCQEGLCLWCWLEVQGVDMAAFYSSGAWQRVIDWRPEPAPLRQIQEAVKAAMQARQATPRGIAEEAGVPVRMLDSLLRWPSSTRYRRQDLEAVSEWAGLSWPGDL